MSDADSWYLLKTADKEVFGPTTLEILQGWAAEAKISPLDKLSRDGRKSWQRAPMIRELQMDWLIQMPDKFLYGPTNIATIQEFLATGEIDENVTIINCKEGTEKRLGEHSFFQVSPHHARSAETTHIGTQWPDQTRGSTDTMLQNRVAILEKQIMQHQRSLDQWEQAYSSLRQQFLEATGREPL